MAGASPPASSRCSVTAQASKQATCEGTAVCQVRLPRDPHKRARQQPQPQPQPHRRRHTGTDTGQPQLQPHRHRHRTGTGTGTATATQPQPHGHTHTVTHQLGRNRPVAWAPPRCSGGRLHASWTRSRGCCLGGRNVRRTTAATSVTAHWPVRRRPPRGRTQSGWVGEARRWVAGLRRLMARRLRRLRVEQGRACWRRSSECLVA